MESWKNEFKRLVDLKLLSPDADNEKTTAFIEETIKEKEEDLEKWKRALKIYKKVDNGQNPA